MLKRSGLVLVASILAAVFASAAAAADWSVARSSGEVWIASGGVQRVALSNGMTLPAGGALGTGQNGRVMLVNGHDTMTIGPNSVVSIPSSANSSGFTTVLQQAGVAEFDVEKQSASHFAVETPYLAAVVKGTHFTVGAYQDGGSVDVQRGVVEVTDLKSGLKTDVFAGQRATVAAGGGLNVSGSGTHAAIEQGSPRPPLLDRLFGRGTSSEIRADLGGVLQLGIGGGNGLSAGVGGGVADASLGGGNGANASIAGVADVGVGGGEGIGASVLGDTANVDVGGGSGIDVDIGGLSIGLGGGGGLLQ